MASERYTATINEMQRHFGISEICARYIFHRVFRSKRKGEKYLPWTLSLQNALVRADKCLGLVWEKVEFGKEAEELSSYGINFTDDAEVFTWVVAEPEDPEWSTVTYKKKKITKELKSLAGLGLFV